MNIEDIKLRINRVTQLDDFDALYKSICHVLEVENYAFCMFNKLDGDCSPTLFENLPSSWVEQYTEQHMFKDDPVILHCLQHHTDILWDDEEKVDPANVMLQAKQAVLLAGSQYPLLPIESGEDW